MNIGKSIKYGLVMKDMRAKDLAERLGVSQNYISLLSNGNKTPSARILTSLALVFGMPVSEFIALGEEKAA
tara:strand:- start:707 stop:919 length:213 start_codon:yes stop_codon:yes gene_type:complete